MFFRKAGPSCESPDLSETVLPIRPADDHTQQELVDEHMMPLDAVPSLLFEQKEPENASRR